MKILRASKLSTRALSKPWKKGTYCWALKTFRRRRDNCLNPLVGVCVSGQRELTSVRVVIIKLLETKQQLMYRRRAWDNNFLRSIG